MGTRRLQKPQPQGRRRIGPCLDASWQALTRPTNDVSYWLDADFAPAHRGNDHRLPAADSTFTSINFEHRFASSASPASEICTYCTSSRSRHRRENDGQNNGQNDWQNRPAKAAGQLCCRGQQVSESFGHCRRSRVEVVQS